MLQYRAALDSVVTGLSSNCIGADSSRAATNGDVENDNGGYVDCDGDCEPEWGSQASFAAVTALGDKALTSSVSTSLKFPELSTQELGSNHRDSAIASDSKAGSNSKDSSGPVNAGPGPWTQRILSACPMFLAGVYSEHVCPVTQTTLHTAGVVTTTANPQFSWLHHRSPLILSPSELAQWLSPSTSGAALSQIVGKQWQDPRQVPVRAYRVSAAVNNLAQITAARGQTDSGKSSASADSNNSAVTEMCLESSESVRKARAFIGIGRFFSPTAVERASRQDAHMSSTTDASDVEVNSESQPYSGDSAERGFSFDNDGNDNIYDMSRTRDDESFTYAYNEDANGHDDNAKAFQFDFSDFGNIADTFSSITDLNAESADDCRTTAAQTAAGAASLRSKRTMASTSSNTPSAKRVTFADTFSGSSGNGASARSLSVVDDGEGDDDDDDVVVIN